MIASIRNRALKQFWTKGDASGLKPEWRGRIRVALDALEVAARPADLDMPGFAFHALTGNMAGRFAISLSRNWRITFGWDGQNVVDLDMEDYHGR